MNTYAVRSALVGTLGVALALAWGSASATTYRLTELTLGGTSSRGYAINDSGQATGNSDRANGATRAFLWDGTRILDLGTLRPLAGTSVGFAINAAGQVAGYATSADGNSHAFLWDGTRMQDLGTLGGTFSQGFAINDSGQVTGDATKAGDAVVHAFLWNGTRMRDLGTLGGTSSRGTAINAFGQVTGYATSADGNRHAFLWDGTRMQNLGTLGGTGSFGSAINDSGQVTGVAATADGNSHAFLWDGTSMQDLGTLGGAQSQGVAINDSGHVTGHSGINDGRDTHAFLWDGTTLQDLGTFGGSASFGAAINAAGQVTGYSFTAGNAALHAFLWDGTTLQDLNDLIDPADPLRRFVTLHEGVDINDRGEIVANGSDSRTGRDKNAYLVSPVPDSPDVAFTLKPASLAFAEQPIGSSTRLNLWLRNKGTAPLTIQEFSLRGADRSQFALRHRCEPTLAAGAGCGVTVTFHPTSTGRKTARLRLLAGMDAVRIVELSGIAR